MFFFFVKMFNVVNVDAWTPLYVLLRIIDYKKPWNVFGAMTNITIQFPSCFYF